MDMHRFRGCFVATLTPFNPAGEVDEAVAAAHVNWLIERGVAGLCPAGTTGEFLFLSDAERQRIVAATAEAAAGRVPVIAGVWSLTAAGAIENARSAERSGADALFCQTPIYYPAIDDEIVRWYSGLREAVSLPVFAYSIPQYAANEISMACLERLAASGAIAGIKDSSGGEQRIAEIIERFGDRAVVYAASDSFASRGRSLGADGFISAIGNAAPGLFTRLWAGDDLLQPQVDALRTALKRVGSIPALKLLLKRRGFDFGGVRIPCVELSGEQAAALNGIALPE